MVKKIKIIMIMIDEEKKLTTMAQYHFQKHPNTRGSHPHTVTLLQIMKFTLTLKRKEKEARRRFREKGAAIWELKSEEESSEICCDLLTWEKEKRRQKITLLWKMKKKKGLESIEKRRQIWEEMS